MSTVTALPSLDLRRTYPAPGTPSKQPHHANRRSCDRCHKKKERCTYEPQAESCDQCVRSRFHCTNLRSRNRPGRRPKTTASGEHGSFHVWDSERADQDHDAATSSKSSPTSSNDVENKSRSGRVVENRELLRRNDPSATHNKSRSDRSVVHGELLRRHQRDETVPNPWRRGLGVSMEQLFDLQSSSVEFFYATNDVFMLGPGFADEFHTSLLQCFEFSPGFLRDSYQAMFTALIWARHQATSFDQVDISRGALSLRRLRTFSVNNLRDAIAVFSLGPTLAAFDVLTRCLGSVTILRHSLSMVQEWYPTLSGSPTLDPIVIAPIFWDTAHCLIRREVPIIRYLLRHPPAVDRVAGMCTTLLPLLHDLCVVSNKWRHSTKAQYAVRIREVEKNILAWSPVLSTEFDKAFSRQEILAMTAHASMHRTAALLIVHRLFNPIGTADDTAKAYAGDIIANLQGYLTAAGQEEKLQHTATPMFLAALEIPNLAAETWICLSMLKAPSICLKKLSAVVDFVWKQRYGGFSGFLLDLLETGPDFVVIP